MVLSWSVRIRELFLLLIVSVILSTFDCFFDTFLIWVVFSEGHFR